MSRAFFAPFTKATSANIPETLIGVEWNFATEGLEKCDGGATVQLSRGARQSKDYILGVLVR
jgi:hypothetical protein